MTLKNFSFLLLSSFFVSCGENTTTSPITDIEKIALNNLNDANISLYATQKRLSRTATVFYKDGTSRDITKYVKWSSSDEDVLVATNGSIIASGNGGDANVTISYASTFFDATKHSIHIKALKSINYSDINISDAENNQTIYVTGNFENNQTDVTMETNIVWSVDTNATIKEQNASQITLQVAPDVTSFVLTGRLFSGTTNEVDFNKTFR